VWEDKNEEAKKDDVMDDVKIHVDLSIQEQEEDMVHACMYII